MSGEAEDSVREGYDGDQAHETGRSVVKSKGWMYDDVQWTRDFGSSGEDNHKWTLNA
jgi:hypothetical protein